jgi:hypothetical protein
MSQAPRRAPPAHGSTERACRRACLPLSLGCSAQAVTTNALCACAAADRCRLYDAAVDGNVQQVRRLISLGVPVDCVSRVSIFGGRRAPTALLVAVQHDRVETVVELMVYGADVNRRFSNGQSALAYCCQHGSEETARRILRHGEWRAEDFLTAWETARSYGRSGMERLLEAARWRRCAELVARQRLALACSMHDRLGAGCHLDRAISGWPATGDLHLMVAQRLPCASVSYGFIVSSTVARYWPLVLRRERLLDEAELLALAEQDEGLEGMDTPLRQDSSFEEEEELAMIDERSALLASGAARRAALACLDVGAVASIRASYSHGDTTATPMDECSAAVSGGLSDTPEHSGCAWDWQPRDFHRERGELQSQIIAKQIIANTPRKDLLPLLKRVLSAEDFDAVLRVQQCHHERHMRLQMGRRAERECPALQTHACSNLGSGDGVHVTRSGSQGGISMRGAQRPRLGVAGAFGGPVVRLFR